MPELIRANAVRVDQIWRAACNLCPWTGLERKTYSEANAEREMHLAKHRREAVND